MPVRRFAGYMWRSLVVLGLAVPAAAQIIDGPPPVLSKLDPLLQPALANPGGRSLVIVRAVDPATVDGVRALIAQTGGTQRRDLHIVEAVAADVPNLSLSTLSNSPLVRRIALDRLTLGSVDRTAATIGSDMVRQDFGYDGTGVGIAVIDSGITAWHDDLTSASAPGTQRVDEFVDFVDGHTTPRDDYGHGTHVAGIIAGNGFDSNGARTGIAPGSRLTVLRVLDSAGHGRISDVIAALDYVLTHRARLNIRVVNLSIGAGVYESSQTDVLTQAAKRVVDAGIVVVASAGNNGRSGTGRRQYGGITAPGNAPWVLTVGASSHGGTANRADDTVTDFSSRGPTAVDRAAKPDVIAPGLGIVSLTAPGSYLATARPDALLPGTVDPGYLPYLSLSGTSQAAPVVTGVVALLLQANPDLTPNAVKAILQYTAEFNSAYDPLTQGAGFVNARGALEVSLALAASSVTYTVDPMWSGHLLWGNARVSSGRLSASANAWPLGVTWGASELSSGATVEWGVFESNGGATPWRIDTTLSENVVWGDGCGGANCEGQPWVSDHTVVWGTSGEGDTVVWGTSDGDTVVWGTSGNETVMWETPQDPNAIEDPMCAGTR